MADDFLEVKYGLRLKPEMRSFAEVISHCAHRFRQCLRRESGTVCSRSLRRIFGSSKPEIASAGISFLRCFSTDRKTASDAKINWRNNAMVIV